MHVLQALGPRGATRARCVCAWANRRSENDRTSIGNLVCREKEKKNIHLEGIMGLWDIKIEGSAIYYRAGWANIVSTQERARN